MLRGRDYPVSERLQSLARLSAFRDVLNANAIFSTGPAVAISEQIVVLA